MKRKVMAWVAIRLCRALGWVPMSEEVFEQTVVAQGIMAGYRNRRYGTTPRFKAAA